MALFGLLIVLSRVPAALAQRRASSSDRYVFRAVKSWRGRGGPEEAREFPGDRDRRDVGGFAAVLEALVGAVQAVLGFPGDPQDVVWLPGLSVCQGDADPGFARVVQGGFYQQPPGDARAGLGDRPLGPAFA